MKITKVCCQGCGADLQVDGSVRFVTCNYCHSRLEVVQDASVTHTRLLETVEENTGRIVENLKTIELQNSLERLDREWADRREGFMIAAKNGQRSLPSAAGSLIGGSIAIVFGIVWTTQAFRMGAPFPFPLVGLGFIGFAIFAMVHHGSNAHAFRDADAHYQDRRQAPIRAIEMARNRGTQARQTPVHIPQ